MHYCTTDWAWYHCPALRLTAVPTCRPCCIQTYWWQSANKHTNVTLGPCHTRNKVEQLYRATLLLNKVAQATVNFPSENDRQTNFASSDTDDDIIISSALLIASTLYQRHQANVRKHTRNSRRIETVSLQQFSCSTHQKLGNSPCQTGNFDEQQSSTTKLLNFVACLIRAYLLILSFYMADSLNTDAWHRMLCHLAMVGIKGLNLGSNPHFHVFQPFSISLCHILILRRMQYCTLDIVTLCLLFSVFSCPHWPHHKSLPSPYSVYFTNSRQSLLASSFLCKKTHKHETKCTKNA